MSVLLQFFWQLPHSQSQKIFMYVEVLKEQIVPDALEEFLRRCYLKKVYPNVKWLSWALSFPKVCFHRGLKMVYVTC